jgi:hypothetical protein
MNFFRCIGEVTLIGNSSSTQTQTDSKKYMLVIRWGR